MPVYLSRWAVDCEQCSQQSILNKAQSHDIMLHASLSVEISFKTPHSSKQTQASVIEFDALQFMQPQAGQAF